MSLCRNIFPLTMQAARSRVQFRSTLFTRTKPKDCVARRCSALLHLGQHRCFRPPPVRLPGSRCVRSCVPVLRHVDALACRGAGGGKLHLLCLRKDVNARVTRAALALRT